MDRRFVLFILLVIDTLSKLFYILQDIDTLMVIINLIQLFIKLSKKKKIKIINDKKR